MVELEATFEKKDFHKTNWRNVLILNLWQDRADYADNEQDYGWVQGLKASKLDREHLQ